MDKDRIDYRLKRLLVTATTTDLGNRLKENWFFIWDDLANPKIGLNLVPNPL
jgi:hypothetical protein